MYFDHEESYPTKGWKSKKAKKDLWPLDHSFNGWDQFVGK